ncbi:hypothetical protein JANAI62_21520 [Jannaschia pagri]|uniref:YihY family inner membrane protein n=1 Tax=Jannaschia pagri TaxID=2829797 RepID=A0ABQ4NM97_9RHOB|nr:MULTISPECIES: YihY/virulence factor BrkB family protein [unclassified Jannaschia]GIT91695.1 hypothetical protein JANAI61_21530 [Jannaschia sp. AI_61]GIT95529.1 hypothetical protein JANAI62_21520 [Jannaschia sp. AI_62]
MTWKHLPRAPVWLAVALRIWAAIDEKRLPLVAAGIAFYGILALFPAIAAVIALWGLIGDPGAVLPQIEPFRGILPDDVFAIIAGQVSTLAVTDSGTLGWATGVSLALALWSTRAGVYALIQGINAVYGERNRRGLMLYVHGLVLTLALVVVALVAIAAILVTPVVLAFVPLGPLAEFGLQAARWGLAIAVLLAGTGIVYRFGPNRRMVQLGWVSPGAVLAVMLWGAASYGFSAYLSAFGTYNEVYGSIGAVIALLMWLFISGFLLLLGAAVNAELERHRDMSLSDDPAGQA